MIQFYILSGFFYFAPRAVHVSVEITHTGGPSFITKGIEWYKKIPVFVQCEYFSTRFSVCYFFFYKCVFTKN